MITKAAPIDTRVSCVFLDGMNLFLRARHAPVRTKDGRALSSGGRPTGALYVFLRTLAAVRRRFPKALLTVAWEGSDANRKAKFAGYKQSRRAVLEKYGSKALWSETSWLKDTLPFAGIVQALSPEWEADDVLASLLHIMTIDDDRVVIVSSDRDLWQLVDPTCHILLPEAAATDPLVNLARVMKEWLVSPEDLCCLRAFLGDKSDDLPGVSRVPRKFLARVVYEHRNVDAVCRLMKAGIVGTKMQRAKILAFEEQARVNFDVMTLRRSVPLSVLGQDKDETTFRRRLTELDIEPEQMTAMFFKAVPEERQRKLFATP